MNTREAARKHNLSPSRVTALAREGRIPGAKQVAGVRQMEWEIPDDWKPEKTRKLTDSQRDEIDRRLADGGVGNGVNALAREFGVQPSYVSRRRARELVREIHGEDARVNFP